MEHGTCGNNTEETIAAKKEGHGGSEEGIGTARQAVKNIAKRFATGQRFSGPEIARCMEILHPKPLNKDGVHKNS